MRERIIYNGDGTINARYVDGELVEGTIMETVQGPMVMGDLKPYQSMIDGSWITSRSQHREHLRAHGCVEVGNDSSLSRRPGALREPPRLKETIARNVYSKLRY